MNRLQFIHGTNVSVDEMRANVEWAQAHVTADDFWDRPCAIVGGGPSAELPSDPKADVFCLNNSWRWYSERSFHPPKYVVMFDARESNKGFVEGVGRDNLGSLTWLVASQCHPEVFKSLKEQGQHVILWHASGPDFIKEKELRAVIGGGTVLSRAIFLAYDLGYKSIELTGVDSSFTEDKHHAYDQPINDDDDVILTYTARGTGPFKTSPTLAAQAEYVFAQMGKLERVGIKFTVKGEGLLPTMWREYLEDRSDPDTWEPKKYQAMWDREEYRKHSPAAAKANDIAANIGTPGKLIDFGVGTGRAAKALRDSGWDVTGVDFAPNCLDEGVDVPLVVAPLWNIPEEVSGNIGICFDVMEHIPTDRVDTVLQNIKRCVPKCLFHISYQPDKMGQLIGEKLHLTVRSQTWWENTLAKTFTRVNYLPESDIFVCEG